MHKDHKDNKIYFLITMLLSKEYSYIYILFTLFTNLFPPHLSLSILVC